jgi:hypothetical protein
MIGTGVQSYPRDVPEDPPVQPKVGHTRSALYMMGFRPRSLTSSAYHG